jgi:hypothetical protein
MTYSPTSTAADERGARFTRIRASDIMTLAPQPARWAVPGYVGEGLSILAGRQKLGKSWLAIDWAIAVASGGMAMGSVACEQGDVLYIDLENGLRRISSRIGALFPDASRRPDLSRFEWTCDAPQLGEGFLDALDDWRLSVRAPRLVVIDAPLRIRLPANPGRFAREADYDALTGLQRWAVRCGVAVVWLHRTRGTGADDPLDKAADSYGMLPYADTVLLLDRDAYGVTLHVRGRDVEPKATVLGFAGGSWTSVGEAADLRRSEERTKILDALEGCAAPMGPTELAGVLGVPVPNISKMMFRMAKAGELKKVGRGLYLHPRSGATQPGVDAIAAAAEEFDRRIEQMAKVEKPVDAPPVSADAVNAMLRAITVDMRLADTGPLRSGPLGPLGPLGPIGPLDQENHRETKT